jgi:cellulose synthase/poly-beta-1,6-N-acetylglucosamine synthase-like glycosyltransferase
MPTRRIAGCIVIVILIVLLMCVFYVSFRDYGFWTILYIPETAILLMSLYVFLPALVFFAARTTIKKNFTSSLPQTDTEKNFFTLLVPAHNEERLLPALLESLKNQSYAKENYQIVVIADNCKDSTSLIAEMYHVNCLQRSTHNPSSKQEALQYAMGNFNFTPGFRDGYVCIIDADCEAHPDFLREMNFQLMKNKKAAAIQSYRYVKNVYESHITLLDAAGEALRNWVFCAPRKLAGASVFGNGSGILFERGLFEKLVNLPGSHLAEDKEWNMYLSEHNTKVDYCACARIGYEAVSLKKDFQRQRKRWIGSHFAMMKTYSWKMLTQSILNLNFMQFDCFCALVQVRRSLLLVSCLLFCILNFLVPHSSFLPHGSWIIIMVCLVLYGMLGLYLVKARRKDYLVVLAVFPLVSDVLKTLFMSAIGKQVSQWNATRVKND